MPRSAVEPAAARGRISPPSTRRFDQSRPADSDCDSPVGFRCEMRVVGRVDRFVVAERCRRSCAAIHLGNGIGQSADLVARRGSHPVCVRSENSADSGDRMVFGYRGGVQRIGWSAVRRWISPIRVGERFMADGERDDHEID